jgi:N-acyl-D-amino-acid deacylase
VETENGDRVGAPVRTYIRGPAIRIGYVADLVLFDPAKVADVSTMDNPRQQCAGIPYVYVDGVAVIDEGRHTGALPGRALRRTSAGTVRQRG